MALILASGGGTLNDLAFVSGVQEHMGSNNYSITIPVPTDAKEIAYACKCGHASGFSSHSVSGATVVTDNSSGLYLYLIMKPTGNSITITGTKSNTANNEFSACVSA